MPQRLKRNLVYAIAAGLLVSISARGAYAMLTSQSSNDGSTLAGGTLTLSNTVGTGSACLSENGTTNINKTCDVLLDAASLWYPVSSTPNPGDASVTSITIVDTGSLPASRLSVYIPSCAKVTTTGANVVGGANPCAATGLIFYVQETDASFNPTYCWFPTAAAGACAFTGLTDASLNTFKTAYHNTATAYSLGTGPAAMGSRYFQIGLAEPSDAINTLQGEAAQFSLMWHMDQ